MSKCSKRSWRIRTRICGRRTARRMPKNSSSSSWIPCTIDRTMPGGADMKEVSRAAGAHTDYRASRTDRRAYLTAWISLVGVGTFMVGVLLLHLLKRDLNPAQHFISEYALGRFGWVQVIDFLAAGVGGIALALTLPRVVRSSGRIVPVFIGIFGVCVLLVAYVRVDGP